MNRKKILIVSRESIPIERFLKSLESRGVELDFCNNVQTAYDKIEKNSYSLFLVVIQISEVNLDEFINKIYKTVTDPVIILITDCKFSLTAEKPLSKTIFDFIKTPLNPDEVSHKINKALNFDSVLKENVILKNKLIELNELFNLSSTEDESLASYEKRYILQVLNKNNWNISRSANILKIDRVTLYNKINKYNLRTLIKAD